MGLNEAAGYLAVGVTAYLTGLIAARAGLRPEPFYMPATTGKPGHETPSGLHKIEWRWPGWHVSTKYPENGQMYQSQYFGPGIALHGVPSHEVHKQPSSHGCVRLYPSDANTLYRDLKVGIPVWVTGRFRYPS